MYLYIIRHGDPIYVTDTLTERGKMQAEAVGKRMKDAKIDRIFTSPMGRAKMTAEPACRMLGLNYSIEPWAHEIEEERLTHYPDGVKKSISLVDNYLFKAEGRINIPFEKTYECEPLKDTQMKKAMDYIIKGGRDFLERLGYKEENGIYKILRKNEERVALFCHSAFARAWISELLHIPVHIMWSDFEYNHTGVTILHFKNYEQGYTSPRLLCYSDLSHLYKYGPDMKYCRFGEV